MQTRILKSWREPAPDIELKIYCYGMKDTSSLN